MIKIAKLVLLGVILFSGAVKAAEMSVTIDDLPFVRIADNESARDLTSHLLKPIIEQKIPVVGFVNEGKLEADGKTDPARVALLQMWIDAGLELGNHTFSHIDLTHNTPESFQEDVIRGETVTQTLMKASGKKLRYFRYPYLHTGTSKETKQQVEQFLLGRGYINAPVTIDNGEWIFALAYEKAEGDKKQEIVASYISYMRDKIKYWEDQSRSLTGGDIRQILLLHANRLNAEAMPQLLQMISSRGYKFISLEDALKDGVYKRPDTFLGSAGISWLHRWAITSGKGKDFFAGEPLVPQFVLDTAGITEE